MLNAYDDECVRQKKSQPFTNSYGWRSKTAKENSFIDGVLR